MTQKKNRIWMIACLFIAGLSIWAVVSQTKSFDFNAFVNMFKNSDKGIFFMAILSMLGIILSEGGAMRCILKSLAPNWHKEKNAIIYGASDIYFSAITPSASGGQPMMAWFMSRDGISMAIITASLVLNLILYTIALFLVALIAWCFNPSLIFGCTAFSKILIIVGVLMLIILVIAFGLLLFKVKVIQKILYGGLKLLDKFLHFKNTEQKKKKIDSMIEEYRSCAQIIAGRKKMIGTAFLWNVLMRLCQTAVSPLIYLAAGGAISRLLDVWQVQVFSYVGSYVIPIPGGMGAADYLLIDGFSQIPAITSAANLALMGRGIAFYASVILSAVIVLVGYLLNKKNSEKPESKNIQTEL